VLPRQALLPRSDRDPPRSTLSSLAEDSAGGGPRGATGWVVRRADGAGPFASRLRWELPEGGQATWESRSARKLGAIAVRPGPDAPARRVGAGASLARRLRRLNWVAAGAFTVGGSLFAIGAAVAQLGSGNSTTSASIYFAGGLFFTTGGYASLLGAINAPRRVGDDGVPVADPWRWWSYEPMQIGWLSAFVLFVGTLAFGISLLNSFLHGLSADQVNRLIWAPEVVGCALFLVSGHLAMAEICHRPRPCLRRRDLAWAIVAVNQLGSVLFAIAALAAFIRPVTASAINVVVANWGTLTGAVCFAVGGVMQGFERPR
jgi:hypothetical protein